jgi:hypothetical protein
MHTHTHTHTPGPWKTVLSASTRAVTTANEAPKQATICRLFTECVAFEPGEFEANARLIAAAPELLQVARDFLLLAALHDWEGAAIDFAKATLAKAEGVK